HAELGRGSYEPAKAALAAPPLLHHQRPRCSYRAIKPNSDRPPDQWTGVTAYAAAANCSFCIGFLPALVGSDSSIPLSGPPMTVGATYGSSSMRFVLHSRSPSAAGGADALLARGRLISGELVPVADRQRHFDLSCLPCGPRLGTFAAGS